MTRNKKFRIIFEEAAVDSLQVTASFVQGGLKVKRYTNFSTLTVRQMSQRLPQE